jgi:hypothetical protein
MIFEMQSKAPSVEAYLQRLPAERREALSSVRTVILENLDTGYAEGMQYGMIGYYVPLALYAKGYHCDPKQPLPFAALASQKNYMSLYLPVYSGGAAHTPAAKHAEWFRQAWAKTGKKLNMGKACIRFKKPEDLALDVIGEAIRRVPVATYIGFCEASLADSRKRKPAKAKA